MLNSPARCRARRRPYPRSLPSAPGRTVMLKSLARSNSKERRASPKKLSHVVLEAFLEYYPLLQEELRCRNPANADSRFRLPARLPVKMQAASKCLVSTRRILWPRRLHAGIYRQNMRPRATAADSSSTGSDSAKIDRNQARDNSKEFSDATIKAVNPRGPC